MLEVETVPISVSGSRLTGVLAVTGICIILASMGTGCLGPEDGSGDSSDGNEQICTSGSTKGSSQKKLIVYRLCSLLG